MRASAGERGGHRLLCGDGARGDRRGSGIGIWKPSRCECAAARRMRASAGERGGHRLLCGAGARGDRRGSGSGIWKPSRFKCAAARRMRASAGERGGRRLLCGDGARGDGIGGCVRLDRNTEGALVHVRNLDVKRTAGE